MVRAGHAVDGEAALDRVELADPCRPETIARGRSKFAPPLNERAWKKTPLRVRMSVPTHTT